MQITITRLKVNHLGIKFKIFSLFFAAFDLIIRYMQIEKLNNYLFHKKLNEVKMNTKLLWRAAELSKMLGMSKTTLWRLRQDEKFPKPVNIGDRMVFWKAKDIQEWIDGLNS